MILYTAIIGEYDTVPKAPLHDGYTCYLLTDKPIESIPAYLGWNVIQVPYEPLTPRMHARKLKALPHKYLPEHDKSVWVDANITITSAPRIYDFATQGLEQHSIFAFAHQQRKTIQDEIKYLQLKGKYNIEILSRLEKYIWNNYNNPKAYRLCAGGFIARNNIKEIQQLNNQWWKDIRATGPLDQELLSLYDEVYKIEFDIFSFPFFQFQKHLIKHKERQL